MEKADGFQFIAEEFKPERPPVERSIDIENASTAADVPIFFHQRHGIIAALDELPTERVQLQFLALNPVIHVLDQNLGGQKTFEERQGRGHHDYG